MNQIHIISDLIKWIEKNLEQPLSIDNVAKKSGYSKWHLQRMFKEVTGCILGTYIRHRRLTHAALALKLTSKPILDIAMQYRFDSQQTFTRSFKKQFNLTPASYRRAENWDPLGLTPPIELDKKQFTLPEPRFITFPDKVFWGVAYKSRCNLNELLSEKRKIRETFFKDYLKKYIKSEELFPSQVFAFSMPQPSADNPDEQEMIYTIAMEEKKNIEDIHAFHRKEGLYVCFKYIGPTDGFWGFIEEIYLAALPALGVKRRKDPDIEIHYHCDEHDLSNGLFEIPLEIECDYCIPVLMKE